MSLTVEDGTGKTDAEAYASVSFSDTYHSNMGNSSWSALTTAQKEEALRRGAQYLDICYSGRWSGVRTSRQQALSWPRAYASDDEGYTIDSNQIPSKVQQANAEAALASVSETLLPAVDGTISHQREKVGELESETSYVGGKPVVKVRPLIHYLVRGFLNNSLGTGTVVRG